MKKTNCHPDQRWPFDIFYCNAKSIMSTSVPATYDPTTYVRPVPNIERRRNTSRFGTVCSISGKRVISRNFGTSCVTVRENCVETCVPVGGYRGCGPVKSTHDQQLHMNQRLHVITTFAHVRILRVSSSHHHVLALVQRWPCETLLLPSGSKMAV